MSKQAFFFSIFNFKELLTFSIHSSSEINKAQQILMEGGKKEYTNYAKVSPIRLSSLMVVHIVEYEVNSKPSLHFSETHIL